MLLASSADTVETVTGKFVTSKNFRPPPAGRHAVKGSMSCDEVDKSGRCYGY